MITSRALIETPMDTAITRLARWITACPLHQNSIATHRARVAVQDTVACMLAGSRKPVTQRAAQAIEGLGSGPCSAIGGTRVAAPWAAMLNGTAAHALDFDDYDFPAATHPSAVLVPAAFALAEELGASGADVLDAYVVGYETMACIGKSVNMAHYERGWHSTATLGTLGATAACARLMKLDLDGCVAALSIATSMAAGFKSQFGTMTKPLHAGLAAKNGVLASRLGRSGVTASPNALDGTWSLLTLMAGDTAKGFERALAELGAPLAIEQFGLVNKRFPTCSYTHRAIAGLLQLRKVHQIDAGQVQHIEVEIPYRNFQVLMYPKPQSEAEARFSMQYCIATAMCFGDVTESDFCQAAIERADLRDLMSHITLLSYPSDPNVSDSSPEEPDHVRIQLKNGEKLETTVGHVPGGPSNPLSEEEHRAKLHQCAATVIGDGRVGELELALSNFAMLPDVHAVTRHFHGLDFAPDHTEPGQY
jgi:2-methylcitrate dehydratase PrpD